MENVFAELIVAVVSAVLFILVVALSSERGTQFLKTIMRWISVKLKVPEIAPHGIGSWILALAVAGLITYGFNLDVLSNFELFSDIDPDLVRAMNMILVWVMAEIEHKKMPKARI